MRILVVDDEEHLRRMMRLSLEAAGYDVSEAADGEEGLRQFGDGRRFDAILLDQRMPGMDGLETLRRMKQQRADAVIVMVTAYATIELAVDAMKLGAVDFVRKPMTPETLRHALAAALSRTGASVAGSSPAPVPLAGPAIPPLEVWTTNGYFVRRVERPAETAAATREHLFQVRRGHESTPTEVIVRIDPQALSQVAKASHRALAPGGAFWRQQTESALVNYLWSEAALPEGNELLIDHAPGSVRDAAVAWSGD